MNESPPNKLPTRKPLFGIMAMASLCTSVCFWSYFAFHIGEWANGLALETALTGGMGGGQDNGAMSIALTGLTLQRHFSLSRGEQNRRSCGVSKTGIFLAAPPIFSTGIASLAHRKDGWRGQEDSCFANSTTPPVLLAPRHARPNCVCGPAPASCSATLPSPSHR